MFSVQQKRDIANAVQKILRDTNHRELPKEREINFHLHVDGAESWSWADIKNNAQVTNPSVNPWNEKQAQVSNKAFETETIFVYVCAKCRKIVDQWVDQWDDSDRRYYVKCPHCNSEWREDYVKCPHCNSEWREDYDLRLMRRKAKIDNNGNRYVVYN